MVLLSILVNAPKFFESEVFDFVEGVSANATNVSSAVNVTLKTVKMIRVTDLREDPNYIIYYNNWTRLVVIGVVPIVLLIYFNYKVSKRKFRMFYNYQFPRSVPMSQAVQQPSEIAINFSKKICSSGANCHKGPEISTNP